LYDSRHEVAQDLSTYLPHRISDDKVRPGVDLTQVNLRKHGHYIYHDHDLKTDPSHESLAPLNHDGHHPE
jgi:hypothetical protein